MPRTPLLALAFLWIAFTAQAGENDYCVAIRGNGENVAAHWAGLGRFVEEKGLPKAMAGGSSATLTMFLTDSMAQNPFLAKEKDEVKKRKMQGLLMKSMPQFMATMAKQEGVLDAYQLMNELADPKSPLVDKVKKALESGGGADGVRLAFGRYAPLVNPDFLRGLANKPDFFQKEGAAALAKFGNFDAQDANLFLRPGLIDFKAYAVTMGNIADFYAGNTDPSTQEQLEKFTQDCAERSYQINWMQMPADCRQRFELLAGNYVRRGQFQNKALFQSVGKNVESIPTTAVVHGPAAARFKDLQASFMQGDTRRDYSKFSVDFTRELSFGYWGQKERLDAIERGLQPLRALGDVKAQKFRKLGPANWFEVLSTSPAEPGLASLQRIPTNTTREQVLGEMRKPPNQRWASLQYKRDETNQEMFSAGGWSDLHPVGVLKASGCERVAYLTRKDGDTIFGQETFIRLTGEQARIPFWNRLSENNNAGWRISGEAAATNWNKLYNLGNPLSSFSRSLANADIVYCTNWNNYDVFEGKMWDMVKEAYMAPVFLQAGTPNGFRINATPMDGSKYPGCVPKGARPDGRPLENPENGPAN